LPDQEEFCNFCDKEREKLDLTIANFHFLSSIGKAIYRENGKKN
jgi:hypothetical protein